MLPSETVRGTVDAQAAAVRALAPIDLLPRQKKRRIASGAHSRGLRGDFAGTPRQCIDDLRTAARRTP